MVFLHPTFTIVTILLIIYSFLEVYNGKKYKSVWSIVVFLIVLVGFRNWVGADYGAYFKAFEYYGQRGSYEVLFNMALFKEENIDMEWLYLFVGKVIYAMGLPFFIFTFVIAVISLTTKYIAFEKYTSYPALTLLLFIFPTYFIADGGQMRQGVAMGLIIFSFLFICKRNFLAFLFTIYIAIGFHKSAFIFLPAYWLVLFPLSSIRILILVIISAILSPFQVYSYISLFESIAPSEVFEGFQAYETIEEANTGTIKLYDLLGIFYTYFLVTYNKEACEKIPYYEYMRNIGVLGVCMYFVFRGSPIFSSRLTLNYLLFMVMVLPNIVAAIQKRGVKRGLHFVLIIFAVFYYFVFAYMQGIRAGYIWESYRNFLW